MSASTARKTALSIVSRVRVDSAWTHDVLDTVLTKARLDVRDRSFVTRLAYGVAEMEGSLDELIDRHVTRPGSLEPKVRDALRLSTYEILLLDTEIRAAVHQGVELVRSVSPRAAGLANAVLRRIADTRDASPFGDAVTDIYALARSTGHPPWLAQRLLTDLGEVAARGLMAADGDPAPLYLAHNPYAGSLEDFIGLLCSEGAEPRPFGPAGCVTCDAPATAVNSSALSEGRGLVVDAAAQTIASLVPLSAGDRVLDLAAGRGTKTALLQANALRAGGPASILAIDIHQFKIDIIIKRMAALGIPGVTTAVADVTDEARLLGTSGGPVDVVFVDAPCSGIGTLRRHPEKRWRLTSDEIDTLALLGSRMLATAAELVRPGGFVVYSTCTVLPAENGDVVRAFLDSDSGRRFATHDVTGRLPAGFEGSVTPEGWFGSLPSRGGPDGHFAAILQSS
ncbi:MAG: transcription antitermination factor NusB [Coriobacteriia bacterium]|nr:transcription antitermination factor NusB [Coriobacteriia bacterium]